MNAKVCSALLACLAAAAIAGCATGEPTTTVTVTATPTGAAQKAATPSTSPSLLSRKAAGKRYLAIVKPVNKATDKCAKATKPLDDGEWSDTENVMKRIRRDCKPMVAANDKFTAALESTPWPADARSDVDDLITENQAQALAYRQIAKARTPEDYFDAMDNYPDDTGAADLVRARLGLPKRDAT